MTKRTIILPLLLCGTILSTSAQTDSLAFGTQYLNQVVVTGTRTPKTLANTPVLTRVITEQDIKRLDATNIKDVLLAELPGLEFSFSMNQQVALTMQGLGGMSILFLIDGERMAGETLDNIDFQRLSMDNVQRIEIVKGAATALYGSNAVGAVINIITKTSKEPWSLHLGTRFGSHHGQQRHGGSYGVKKGRWNNMLNVQNDRMNSYTVHSQNGDSTTVYGNRQWNFRDKLTYNITDRAKITGRAGYYFHERNTSALSKDRARDFSGGLSFAGYLSDDDHIDVGYSFDRYDKSDYYPSTGKDFLDYKNVQNVLRVVYTHNFEDDLALTIGGDAMNDYLKSYQFTTDSDNHQQQTADLFAQADWTINRHWEIVGGMRGDYFSHYGWEITPKLSAMYSLENLRLRASYSKGFRAPTLKEMYMSFNMANVFYIYGNENLESENSHSFALSSEYTKKNYNFTLTGNYNLLNNEITTLWNATLDNGRGAMEYHNISGTKTLNIEATASARYDCGLGFRLSYAYFHEYPKDDAKNTAATRPHSLTAQVCWAKTFTKDYGLTLMLNGRWLSKADYYTISSSYDDYVSTSSAGYSIWRLSLQQRFLDAVSLIVNVDNLFNYKPDVYEFNSPYTVGTTANIGASIEIEQIWKKIKKSK